MSALTFSSSHHVWKGAATKTITIMMVSLMPLVVFYGSVVAAGRRDTCYSGGVVYQHGDVFTVNMGHVCQKFRCFQGNWLHQQSGCLRHGICYLLDVPFNVNCTSYVCTKVQPYEFVITELPARNYCDAEDTCRSVGTEYFMNGCNRYLCANDSSGTPQNVFQEQYCDAGDKCRSVGSEYFMNGCNRYLCTNDSSGTPQHELQEQYCTDHYGRCHPPGERFDYSVMGNFSNNCTCEFADDSSEPYYSCSDELV